MNDRDEFSDATKKILAERAGQKCSNPDCLNSTSGPADFFPDKATKLGKASHITAAAAKGPRHHSNLTPAERSAAENGIWLCAECADRVDKKENERRFPVSLLRMWKQFHESVSGTDFHTKQGRRRYPIRRLSLHRTVGVVDEASITFGAITAVSGTSILSRSICQIIKSLVSAEERSEISKVWPNGKMNFTLSNGDKITLYTDSGNAAAAINDTRIPVFQAPFQVVDTSSRIRDGLFIFDSDSDNMTGVEALSRSFSISESEIIDCLKGLPSEESLFGYTYQINSDDLTIIAGFQAPPISYFGHSSGEKDRIHIDIAFRIASYKSKQTPTVLLLDQDSTHVMDAYGWSTLVREAAKRGPEFQIIINFISAPKDEDFDRVVCYTALGKDRRVAAFEVCSWAELSGRR